MNQFLPRYFLLLLWRLTPVSPYKLSGRMVAMSRLGAVSLSRVSVAGAVFFAGSSLLTSGLLWGQTARLYPRSIPPKFEGDSVSQVFFPDVRSAISEEGLRFLPSGSVAASEELAGMGPSNPGFPMARASEAASLRADSVLEDPPVRGVVKWNEVVSPESLEDLVKLSKLRLDKAITSPAAFVGGTYRTARREFSLLAVLFAITEQYPQEVRWQKIAPSARTAMVRVAGNIKGGSRSAFEEARRRQQDLEDLLRGSGWQNEPTTEIVWEKLIDQAPLMQVLEWAYQDNLVPASANSNEFSRRKDDLLRFSELVAVLAEISLMENMPYADDENFQDLTVELSRQAKLIRTAVVQNEWEMARLANGQMGQACSRCHESYRF